MFCSTGAPQRGPSLGQGLATSCSTRRRLAQSCVLRRARGLQPQMQVFKRGRSRHPLVLEAAPLWYGSTSQAQKMLTWPQISLQGTTWPAPGVERAAQPSPSLSSTPSSPVGWVRRMTQTDPAPPSGSCICALSPRARPSQQPHTTPADWRFARRCTGIDLRMLALALSLSCGLGWWRDPRVLGEFRGLLCADEGATVVCACADAGA